jgi:hypothetical protein
MRVLDAGPISRAELERYDDPDIETGLEHSRHGAGSATFRLIEVGLDELEDTARFPFDWQPTWMVGRMQRGDPVPPVVVVQTDRGQGLGLIDGLNRTYAHWLAGLPTIRAYELLLGGHS